MSFITILETLLLGPLKLLFEIIFQVANKFLHNPGLSIIFLSLMMNILVLPLYKRADAMQEEARDIDLKLSRGVNHIKKVFSGDEKMMILQTYYRQNNYKPTDALNGSVSLLLEVPFFMAAYQFLSHLQILEGVSLGPIADLSKPDGLIVIAGIAINVLPVLMTLVNVISSALYLKGFPLKTKIQLYGMALFFLVFLYTSPSGLVFYWTLNNVFSLVKTIFYKLKNPKKVLTVLTSLAGLAVLAFGIFFYEGTVKKEAFLIILGVLLQLPAVFALIKKLIPASRQTAPEAKPNKAAFTLGGLFLTVLIGLLIPATFIAASPQEYVDVTYFHNPLWYVVSSAAMAAGFFLVWLRVFYWLATNKGKVIFERLIWIACGVLLVNYMFFGTDLGVISSSLQYENGLIFQASEQLINLAVIAVLAVVLFLVMKKWSKAVVPVLLVGTLAFGVMSGVHLVTTNNSINQLSLEQYDETPNIHLSTEGENVMVIMLDRAIGAYVPYLVNERPELQEKLDGFTYYANTVSHGGHTNFGAPGLLGGYEYTPVEMNKRSDELLKDKHNEAVKLMPVVFSENGFDVTVCDPIYTDYEWTSDLSIFDEYPNVKAYITDGKFSEPEQQQYNIDCNHRNFFLFSVMKTMPVCLQTAIYDNGSYYKTDNLDAPVYSVQKSNGPSIATGYKGAFMDAYNVLVNLPNITTVDESSNGTFLFLANNMTHEPMLLKEPEYVPQYEVDNTQFDAENADRFSLNGVTLEMVTKTQNATYQTNMAALLRLGEWFDYLRQEGVYDNTRIIIVSDHGYNMDHNDMYIVGEDYAHQDVEYYYPLLLVKDFNAHGFTTSEEFMTNADVPTLAFADLIENPVNPFTGKAITNEEKYAHDQFVIASDEWEVTVNNGTTYLPSTWLRVHTDMRDKNNWAFLEEWIVLDEHAFPAS